jgi:hypothetical protein
MPILNNERHERFCQAIAAGMSQTQAYIYRPESGQYDQQSEPFSAGSLSRSGGHANRQLASTTRSSALVGQANRQIEYESNDAIQKL